MIKVEVMVQLQLALFSHTRIVMNLHSARHPYENDPIPI